MLSMVVSVFVGVVTGLSANYFFSKCFIPKIEIADDIAESEEDGKRIFKIKVINSTNTILNNVQYCLRYIETKGHDGVKKVKVVPPRENILMPIFAEKTDKDFDNAVRLSFELSEKFQIDDSHLFEFIIAATHSLSGTSRSFKKVFKKDNIVKGIYETRNSLKVVSLH